MRKRWKLFAVPVLALLATPCAGATVIPERMTGAHALTVEAEEALAARPGRRGAPGTQLPPTAGQKQGTNSVAAVLNEDGSIQPGANGSFDVSGFSMAYGPNGAPRFVRAQAACGPADWDAQFGLNGTNGGVNVLAVMGNAIYVGGFFTAAGNVAANGVAKFDTTTNTWSALSQGNGNGVDGFVNALAVSGNSLFVGVAFGSVANLGGTGATPAIPANRIAKFDTTTNTWSALSQGSGNGVGGNQVLALAVSGNSLFVGGDFTTANQGGTGATPAIPANGVAKFDITTNTWSALSQGDGNGVSSTVAALAVSGNSVFVGGVFTTVNQGGTGATPAITANNVATFDTTTNTWSGISQGNGNGVNNTVLGLAVSGNSLFVGGNFTMANQGGTGATPAITANRVAKFDTTTNTWSALSQGDGNGVNFSVKALAVSGNSLFVGGSFTTANLGGTGATPAITANNVAKFDITTNTWAALKQGDGNGVSDTVFALAVSGNSLFVGGSFTTANQGGTGVTPAISASQVAKFDITANTWTTLKQGDGNGVTGSVNALAVSGNSLFVGGSFTIVGNVAVNSVARFDTTTNTWSALAQGNGNGVASYNGDTSAVNALAVIGNGVYVGGNFHMVNRGGTGATPAISAEGVARFDLATNTWSNLSQGDGNGVNSSVMALAVSGSSLYVGGFFSTANVSGVNPFSRVSAHRVAKFDTITNTWSALTAQNNPNANGVDDVVFAVVVSGSNIFVGGSFTNANDDGGGGGARINANRVAKFDTITNTWSALSEGNGNGVTSGGAIGLNNRVRALAVIGNSLFVGGNVTTANQGGTGATPAITANGVAKFDITANAWSALSNGNGNGLNTNSSFDEVRALAVSGNSLFVGGSFVTANLGGTGATPAITANNVAKFDTIANIWSALAGSGGGNGVNGDNGSGNLAVDALAVKDCDLFVGGDFLIADNKVSQSIARYGGPNATPTPTLAIDNVTANEGNSGPTPFVFTVTLSAASASTVTVNFATADGTATVASGDYMSTSGTVTFTPGQTSQPITVPVNGDTSVEPNETFFVNLTSPTNATIAVAQGTGTIQNDDAAPLPTLSISSVAANEGNSGPTPFGFTVTLSAASASTVTVNFATADGTATTASGDYVATSGTLTFAPGETSKPVTVTVNGDTSVEPNETFFVNLTSPTNATIAVAQGTGTITDDDSPPAAIPTLSEWGKILLGLSLLALGTWRLGNHG
jgi:hypothetical protein